MNSRYGGTVWLLMAANLLVFVAVHVAAWCGAPENVIAAAVALPSHPAAAAAHPWTLLVYMFTQWDFMHLLSNMLWLWMFGMLAQRLGITGGRIAAAYMTGGLVGAVFFVVLGALGVTDMMLIGASCSVLSVVAMTGIMRGRVPIQMMFLGEMQVRWVALTVVVLVMLTSSAIQDTGIVLTHAAGALTGILCGTILNRREYRNGTSRPIYAAGESRRGSAYGPYPKHGLTPSEQAELDALLAEVRRNGYAGIPPQARQRLFELSARIK